MKNGTGEKSNDESRKQERDKEAGGEAVECSDIEEAQELSEGLGAISNALRVAPQVDKFVPMMSLNDFTSFSVCLRVLGISSM